MFKRNSEISDPLIYLRDKGEGGWILKDEFRIPDMHLLQMKDFQGENHCSLTALTSIFSYYRNSGFINIDGDKKLFDNIKQIALKNKYYKKKRGTYPWYMDDLVRKIWSSYSYGGRGQNRFLFFNTPALINFLKSEIDALRPGLINFTHNQYPKHTVTFYGYRIYKKACNADNHTGYLNIENISGINSNNNKKTNTNGKKKGTIKNEEKFFLVVNNHWTNSPRYVDCSNIGEQQETFFSLCLIRP